MSENVPIPPPLHQPPPAPPPEALLADGLYKVRRPALLLMASAVLNALIFLLITIGALGLGVWAYLAANSPDATVALILAAIVAIPHLVALALEMLVAYGALRLLRTQGYNWAIAAPILHLIIAIIHSMVLFFIINVLSCVVVPFEAGLALTSTIMCFIALQDPRVRLAFKAVEEDPSLFGLLQASRD
ncbi:MAG: hypothetical protein AB8H79_14870 [Myxococcota bacterium]